MEGDFEAIRQPVFHILAAADQVLAKYMYAETDERTVTVAPESPQRASLMMLAEMDEEPSAKGQLHGSQGVPRK